MLIFNLLKVWWEVAYYVTLVVNFVVLSNGEKNENLLRFDKVKSDNNRKNLEGLLGFNGRFFYE